MNNIDSEKRALRALVKSLKQNYSVEELLEKSRKITNILENKDYFRQAQVIAAYWSLPDEVATQSLIFKFYTTKIILLPVVDGDDLALRQFTGTKNMIQNQQYGMFEPAGDNFYEYEKIDLIIVPGLAFDSSGRRLGRGKAYYDRFLLKVDAFKVGLCFDFQYFQRIPVDVHDISVDDVIFA